MKTILNSFSVILILLGSSLCAQFQWYPNANYFGVEPVDGYWDDPANWIDVDHIPQEIPQDGDHVAITGLTWHETKHIVITYRNNYDPDAAFEDVLLGTSSPFLTFDFLINSEFHPKRLGVGAEVTVKHSTGNVFTQVLPVSGTYELSGTGSILPFDSLGTTFRVNPGGFFQHTSSGTVEGRGAEINERFSQSSGVSRFHTYSIMDADAEIMLAGGRMEPRNIVSSDGVPFFGSFVVGGSATDNNFTGPAGKRQLCTRSIADRCEPNIWESAKALPVNSFKTAERSRSSVRKGRIKGWT